MKNGLIEDSTYKQFITSIQVLHWLIGYIYVEYFDMILHVY